MNAVKVLIGFVLCFGILAAFSVASYMPPDDPAQVLHHPATGQSYTPVTGTHAFADRNVDYAYSLSIIEMNEDGLFADPGQVNALLDQLAATIASGETAIILYVHGWNHNAAADDTNLACFNELLTAAAVMQATYATSARPRNVYGIFVGWPGVVYETIWLNKMLTWFGRQSASDRIGERGALLQLFSRIGALREADSERTKFVIASHSLGARITYKTLRPIIRTAVDGQDAGGRPPIADLTVMVNPALTADEHAALAELIESQAEESSSGAPAFVIATSEEDEVLGGVFPISQKISSFVRGDYSLSEPSRTQAIGLFDAYTTHALNIDGNYGNRPGSGICETMSYDELEIISGRQRIVDNSEELYDYSVIRHVDSAGNTYSTVLEPVGASSGPVMVVSVSGEIIPNHDDIYTSPFVDFLVRIMNAGLYRRD